MNALEVGEDDVPIERVAVLHAGVLYHSVRDPSGVLADELAPTSGTRLLVRHQ